MIPSSPDSPAILLLAGFTDQNVAELRARLVEVVAGEIQVEAVADVEDLVRRSTAAGVAVVCLGPGLLPAEARRILSRVTAAPGAEQRRHVVLAAGPRPELFQDLVSDDLVFYLSQKMPPLVDTANILGSAFVHQRARRDAETTYHREFELSRLLAIAENLAQQKDPQRASAATSRAVAQVADADRGECLFYEDTSETLWAPATERGGEEKRESAAAGLVSFVLRTGAAVRLDRVDEDPRYDPGADLDQGSPRERFLAVRVATADQRPVAVLVARREESRPPFTEEEEASLSLLAEQISPLLGRFVVRRTYEGMDEDLAGIYRREALDHHTRGFGEQGDLLQVSPAWTPWAYRLTLLAFLVAFAYAVLGSIHEYTSGPAVLRTEGRTEVIAPISGLAAEIEVGEGDEIEAGQLLIRLSGAPLGFEVERLETEVERAAEARRRAPDNPEAPRTLGVLEERLRQARARLDQRSIRAPRSGTVGALHVSRGQPINAGEPVLALYEEGASLELLAFFPAPDRAQLRSGQPLHFSPRGYSQARQALVIEEVGDSIVGPAKARALAGVAATDPLPLPGPVVLVRARLPGSSFESGGRRLAYHEGLLGSAEVRVRSQPILLALFPGLEGLLGGADG